MRLELTDDDLPVPAFGSETLTVSVDTGTFAPTPAYQAWDNFANAANTASGNPLSEVGGNGSPLFGLGPVWTPSRDERMPLIIS